MMGRGGRQAWALSFGDEPVVCAATESTSCYPLFQRLAVALAKHENRNRCMRQNFLRFAADQKTRQAASPVRCHEDDIAIEFLRGGDDA